MDILEMTIVQFALDLTEGSVLYLSCDFVHVLIIAHIISWGNWSLHSIVSSVDGQLFFICNVLEGSKEIKMRRYVFTVQCKCWFKIYLKLTST